MGMENVWQKVCPNDWHDSAPARAQSKQQCPECPAQPFTASVNDIDAWADTAKDLGLRVVSLPKADGSRVLEIVIFKQDERDKGYLWVQEYRLFGQAKLTEGEINGDLTAGEAFGLLGILARGPLDGR